MDRQRQGGRKSALKRMVCVTAGAALVVGIGTALTDSTPGLAALSEGAALYSALFTLPEGGRQYLRQQTAHAAGLPATAPPAQSSSEALPASSAASSPASSQPSASSAPPASSQAPLPSGVKGRIVSQQILKTVGNRHSGDVYLSKNTNTDVDIAAELGKKPDLKMTLGQQPEVLILHTHATESYFPEGRDTYTAADQYSSTDNSKNIVKVGETLAAKLTATGVKVLHDKTRHDEPSFTASYSRAAATIKSYLKKYPGIKVVIDLHRDSISKENSTDKLKTVATIKGKTAAQVMLVNGCNEGRVTDFPNWRSNLRLSLRVQQELEKSYPGLARPVRLVAARYNQNLTKGSMLIEVGTEANTLSEALYSAELLGDALGRVLKTLK